MVLDQKPHSRPRNRARFSSEHFPGIVAQVLPQPNREPPKIVSAPLPARQDEQTTPLSPSLYTQYRKMTRTPLLTVKYTRGQTYFSGF